MIFNLMPYSIKTRYLLLKWINIIVLNLIPATRTKKVGAGAIKTKKSHGMLKKHLFGTFHE